MAPESTTNVKNWQFRLSQPVYFTRVRRIRFLVLPFCRYPRCIDDLVLFSVWALNTNTLLGTGPPNSFRNVTWTSYDEQLVCEICFVDCAAIEVVSFEIPPRKKFIANTVRRYSPPTSDPYVLTDDFHRWTVADLKLTKSKCSLPDNGRNGTFQSHISGGKKLQVRLFSFHLVLCAVMLRDLFSGPTFSTFERNNRYHRTPNKLL